MRKPVFVPEGSGFDPVELARHWAEAERFKATFARQFDRTRTAHVDRTNYVDLNRETIGLPVKRTR